MLAPVVETRRAATHQTLPCPTGVPFRGARALTRASAETLLPSRGAGLGISSVGRAAPEPDGGRVVWPPWSSSVPSGQAALGWTWPCGVGEHLQPTWQTAAAWHDPSPPLRHDDRKHAA